MNRLSAIKSLSVVILNLLVLLLPCGASAFSGSGKPFPAFVCGGHNQVAVMFVGHGEPPTFEEGNVPTYFWDGTPFGPHGVELGVPEQYQLTEWGAAFEEIATALAYQFGDYNGNGIRYEVLPFPMGDVPPFFTFEAFISMVEAEYMALGNYSPHSDMLREHVDNTRVGIMGCNIDMYLALLDDYPRIPDVLHEIAQNPRYKRVVVAPLLLSRSSHSQEVEEIAHEWVAKERPMEVVYLEPLFEIPFARRRIVSAVAEMAKLVRESVPASIPDDKIGVVVGAHGTPYKPPYPEFGWEEGDLYSRLPLFEEDFLEAISNELPWELRNGRMSFSHPTIEESLAAFEADGKTHAILVPSVFKTPSIHTMWDLGIAAVGRPVLPSEGVVSFTRPSGMTVWFTSKGIADEEPGRELLRSSMRFVAESGLLELFENNREQHPRRDR